MERFWSKVDKNSGVYGDNGQYSTQCWIWTAAKQKTGYGRFKINGILQSAHRVSWELKYGLITKDKWVLHRCDNPSCVRPDHLFLGDRSDNMLDAQQKGRLKHLIPTNIAREAKLTEDDVRTVRRLRQDGKLVKEIAIMFNVKRHTISRICNGKSWKHVK
jgi:hypothetical protein